MEASDLKAARERLILKRNQIIRGLRTRHEAWPEFQQVCREIVELDNKLGEGASEDASDSAQ